jgi:DNA polymerase-3 subunit alpha
LHSILAARSNFSIGESILDIDGLIEAATAAGAKAVGLTDTMSITSMIDFSKKAKKAGLKPIIGCRLRLVDKPEWRKTKDDKKAPQEYFVTYYVLSEKGLGILFKLLSLANTEDTTTTVTDPVTGEDTQVTKLGRFYFTSRLSFDDLYAALADATPDDVAIASSDVHSVGTHKDAANILTKLKALLSAANVFMSVSPIDTPYYDTLNMRSINIAGDLGLPVLVTRPAFYKKGEADPNDVMNAITRNTPMSSMWAYGPVPRDMHVMSSAELIVETKALINRLIKRNPKFSETINLHRIAGGLRASDTLADMVKYEWKKSPASLPQMAPDEFLAVVEQCKKGFTERLGQITFGHKPLPEDLKTIYMPRLAYELGVIKRLGHRNGRENQQSDNNG